MVLEIPQGIFVILNIRLIAPNSFQILKLTIDTPTSCSLSQLQTIGNSSLNFFMTTVLLLSAMTDYSIRQLVIGKYIPATGSSLDCFV